MTSAPVKDVGSLMNYVGSKAAPPSGTRSGSTDSFGDLMNKASGDRTSCVKTDSRPDVSKPKLKNSYVQKKTQTAENTGEDVKTSELTPEQEQAVKDAGQKLVEETAEKLGVSEEEVLDAMEELGFGITALFDAENLTQLVLTLSGEESPMVLLTNEELYGTMQDLLQTMQGIKSDLMEEFSLTPEALEQILAQAGEQADMPEAETPETEVPEMNRDTMTQDMPEEGKEAPQITITVEEGTETVKLTTDEKGNVKQVEGTLEAEMSEITKSDARKQGQSKGGTEHQSGNERMQTGNPILDALFQNKTEVPEMTFEQTAAYSNPATDKIMNQILDFMKIQLKPGMEQLEMQLHPESLGSLHIQLTSKGGEITAQFHVQNEAVKAAIESQIVELKDTLKEQGIKVEAVEVTVESHAFESNLWQGQGRDENASYQGNRKSPRRINLNELEEGFEETAQEEEVLAAKMMEANGNTVDYTA